MITKIKCWLKGHPFTEVRVGPFVERHCKCRKYGETLVIYEEYGDEPEAGEED